MGVAWNGHQLQVQQHGHNPVKQNTRNRFEKILELRAKGLTSPQIGERLGVSAELVRWTTWKARHAIAQDAALKRGATERHAEYRAEKI